MVSSETSERFWRVAQIVRELVVPVGNVGGVEEVILADIAKRFRQQALVRFKAEKIGCSRTQSLGRCFSDGVSILPRFSQCSSMRSNQ